MKMLNFSEIFEFSSENSYFERIRTVRMVRMVRMVRSLADRTFQPRFRWGVAPLAAVAMVITFLAWFVCVGLHVGVRQGGSGAVPPLK